MAKVQGLGTKVVLLALTVLSTACHTAVKEQREQEVVWRRVGAWSGGRSIQTESFESDTGSFRVQWKTGDEAVPGQGTFRLSFHSSISGRELQVAVDRTGTGADTAYVQQVPNVFYAKVESANIEWSFTVDEAVTTR